MDFANSDPRPARADAPLHQATRRGLKIVIVGGFGVGKTTMVRAVSEIRPLDTEAIMTDEGLDIDDPSGAPGKSTTTVAFDFGRITIDDEHVLYLFGAPGQERFRFLWDRLFTGALGAIVLVDPHRIADSWYAIDRLEHQQTPFIVACNDFGAGHRPGEVRDALDLDPHVPVIDCDARSRESGAGVLITLVEHLYSLATPPGRPLLPTPEAAS
ncbi:ATP/GTP-binding protein [Nocardia gipuzkoensis]|uniref:GTP-binding protein n=1 Tax=Nocardia gipuzkoensis TaxID=2749991 RepID=UPI001E50C462|nr:ATP/GTP-binding protein [Nocardia gipuzkoensis]UGT68702.1 ATP/GTP-binding protein [Nocardia gipuzkoensis]